jgi:hypothetical protein
LSLPSISSPLSLSSVFFPLTHPSVSFPESDYKKWWFYLTYCTSTVSLSQNPCFSSCRAALVSGTGLQVWEGGKGANLSFFSFALGAFDFFVLYFLRPFALTSAKARKKCRRPPLT